MVRLSFIAHTRWDHLSQGQGHLLQLSLSENISQILQSWSPLTVITQTGYLLKLSQADHFFQLSHRHDHLWHLSYRQDHLSQLSNRQTNLSQLSPSTNISHTAGSSLIAFTQAGSFLHFNTGQIFPIAFIQAESSLTAAKQGHLWQISHRQGHLYHLLHSHDHHFNTCMIIAFTQAESSLLDFPQAGSSLTPYTECRLLRDIIPAWAETAEVVPTPNTAE